ncbi:MAG: hypothetical protein WCS21_11215, partial [Lachnospiraceae bacterium]
FSGLESGWPTATRRLGIPYPRDPLTITLNGTAGDAIRDKDVALLEEMTSPYVGVVSADVKNANMPVSEDDKTV